MNPDKFQVCVLEKEVATRGALAVVRGRMTFTEAKLDQLVCFWSAHCRAYEDVIDFEGHALYLWRVDAASRKVERRVRHRMHSDTVTGKPPMLTRVRWN